MASNDIRDIMNVAPPTEARPAKKQKLSAQQRKDQYAGMSKEVRGLMMGDGVPPVQVQENRYKTKPKIAKRPQPWTREAFTNPARSDNLVLRHWKRATPSGRPDTPSGTGAPVTPAESKTEHDGDIKSSPAVQPDYYFAKYNTKPSGPLCPSYNEEEYNSHLKSENWDKEETDYLVQLVLEYDLRWIVIWDRYDYKPTPVPSQGEDSMAVVPTSKPRSMEEMKHRYYEVCANVMTIRHPMTSMSTAEFDLHEKMTKFDPKREMTRKHLAEQLLARSPDELREEEVLLGELKRIVDHEDRFMEERKELYQRLDHPSSNGNISMYESSAGLMQLVQSLLTSDKNKKRRSLAGPDASNTATSNNNQAVPTSATSGRGEHRASLTGPGTGSNKKGSGNQGVQPRQLSQRDEIRFGVAHHDRLTSGVQFRQSRIEKLVLAKSAAQQQKLHDALGVLGVGVRVKMPTSRVCAEYETLVQQIHVLLDVRKVSEKVGNEIKVLEAQRDMRERKERGEDDQGDDKPQTDGTNDKADAKDGDVEKADVDADGETQEQKRSESDNEDDQGETQDQDNNDDNEDEGDEEDPDTQANPTPAADNDDEDQDEEDESNDSLEAQLKADKEEEDEDDAEPQVEDSDQDEVASPDEDQEDEEEDEEAGQEEEENDAEDEDVQDSKAASISHKRSASVLSMGSEKSTKKARK